MINFTKLLLIVFIVFVSITPALVIIQVQAQQPIEPANNTQVIVSETELYSDNATEETPSTKR